MTKSVAAVGVHEAKTHLSRLLDRVAAGEEIEITRRGDVIARLVPPPRRRPRHLGVDAGRLRIADDFDAPLPEDKRHPWQQEHQPNLTGTAAAYRPPGHELEGGRRARATGDYEAWTPEMDAAPPR